MGKCFISLVVMIAALLMVDAAANELETRKAQEELRKRHLFFDDIDGKHSPELSAAVQRYQQKKGFQPTGILDEETLASLGLADSSPTPPGEGPPLTVLAPNREVRNANGELLPRCHLRLATHPPLPVDRTQREASPLRNFAVGSEYGLRNQFWTSEFVRFRPDAAGSIEKRAIDQPLSAENVHRAIATPRKHATGRRAAARRDQPLAVGLQNIGHSVGNFFRANSRRSDASRRTARL
ncbi:MAG: peptidoglycan-binding domain-containing protein [Chthoniobacterales bacterium]